jgi:hypothetical protein
MMELPDPLECWENAAERYADENMKGDSIRCANCGGWVPLDQTWPSSNNPYSPPICYECVEPLKGKL